MSQLLPPGQHIKTTTGLTCQVEHFLGSGTQGEVYRATLSDRPVALKWFHSYYIHQDVGLRERLAKVVHIGAPNDQFLWPLAVVTSTQTEGFGYVMRLREPGYRSIVELMKRGIVPNFRLLTTIALELADSFLQLHTQGLCYRDISSSNVFFHPQTGKVLISDNDNVTIDGSASTGVLGTPDFMAPEVVRREALPNRQTDLYSLAVLLFYLLHNHHPLYGKKLLDIACLDLPARMKLCGDQSVFIFDPDDTSNEALPIDRETGSNAIAFWSIYPEFLKALFVQSFTTGLRDPEHGRVREGVWRSTMTRLRDSIFYCSHCSAENFYDVAALKTGVGHGKACWRCNQPLQAPARMRINSAIVMLNVDTVLYPHHLDRDRLYDFSQPAARIIPQFNHTGLMLQNLSHNSWLALASDGTAQHIEPGQLLPLQTGLQINFGNMLGEVRI